MAEKIKQGILVPGEYEDISEERQNKEFSFILLRPDDDEALLSAGMEIIFVLMGRGTFLEMNTEIAHTIREGDIFVINSFSMRRLVLEEGGMAMVLKLSPYFIRSVSPETPDPYINCKSFLYDQDRQENFNIVRRDFAQAFNAYYKNNSGHSAYIRVKLTALLGDLIRFFAEEPPQKRNDTGKERLRTAVDYILRRFRENITLDDLAAATYLSKTYISHSFQKYLGISFTGYLTLVRLMNAEVLLQGDATVTEVAYESGFASANAMIKAFKQYRKMTPGAYRRHFLKERSEVRPPAPMSETGFSNVFSSLMRYMDGDSSEEASLQKNACELCVDLREPGKPYNNHWRMVINAGYAKDVMNGTLQEQIKMVQSCIGFKYIRIKGIMDDDMGVYIRDMLGQLAVNFTYVDAVIDFILSAGALPMIELSHMPSELAAYHKKLSMRNIYWAPAKDLERWAALIGELMEHLVQRYGMAQLEKWLFIPWIPPSTGNNEDAISAEKNGLHYQAAYMAIKAISPRIKVCGPGAGDIKFFRDFFKMCVENKCLPDMVSLKLFSCIQPGEEKGGLKLIGNNESFYMAVSGDEKYLSNIYNSIYAALEAAGAPRLPILLEEWSNNIWQRDLCNDTCYKSAYIFKSVIENGESYEGMGYFAISDQMDEIPPVSGIFHGGFGLFAKQNLPKSAFRAMELLKQMGNRVLLRSKGCLITENKDGIQIFLYNYCHYDMLYRYRHTINISVTDRYRVFNKGAFQSYNIAFKYMKPGRYRVRRYKIGPEGGSAYDAWAAMGAPEYPDPFEWELLKGASYPWYHTEAIESEGDMKIQMGLNPHEVSLIAIELEM